MPWQKYAHTDSFPAASDLDAKQFHLVKLDANGKATPCTVLGELALGVLDNDADAGDAALVALNGTSRLVAGAAVSIMDKLTTNASGRAVTAAAGNNVRAIALEAAAADGDIISVLLVESVA